MVVAVFPFEDTNSELSESKRDGRLTFSLFLVKENCNWKQSLNRINQSTIRNNIISLGGDILIAAKVVEDYQWE